jgi:hypothetical protein
MDVLFPRTPAPNTFNARPDGEMTDGVREKIARTLREFEFTLKGCAQVYQKLYPDYFDRFLTQRVLEFLISLITRDDAKTTYEHVGQFLE